MNFFKKPMILIVIALGTFCFCNAQQFKQRNKQLSTSRNIENTSIFTRTELSVSENPASSTTNRDAWITWSGEPQEAVGAGNNSDFTLAQRFEPSDLTSYDGKFLSKIKFVPSVETCVYEIQVMVGGSASQSNYNPGTTVRSRTLETNDLNIGQWNEVDVIPAVEIDASQELWIAYRCISQTGNPAGCDLGPRVPGKGNLILYNGVWSQMYDLDPMFDINWCIQGLVEDNEPSFLFPNEVTNFNINAGANGALNATLSWTNPTTTADGATLTSINSIIIERNGEYLTSITETAVGENVTWTDNDIYESGYYIYKVTPVNEYGTGLFVKDTVAVGTFCETTISMTDGYGDGWNGNSIQFKTITGETVGNATLENGFSGEVVISMPNVELYCSWTIGAFPDEVSFVIYNPSGDEVYNCPVGEAAALGGFFVSYLNSCSTDVPQAPSNLQAEAAGGNVNLSWTNPSQSIAGNSLSQLTNVIIKRNGTIIHVIENAVVGGNVSWTDTTIPVAGEYEYSVAASNEAGVGLSAYADVVVGDVCNVIIRMFDTFGDGWYGNSAINITKDGVFIGMAKLYSGSYGIDTIIVPMGTLDFSWVAGNNDAECSFIISDKSDIQIYASSGTPVAGSFFLYDNTCADPELVTVSGVVTDSETNQPVSNAFLRFTGALNPTTTSNESGEYSVEAVVNQSYEVYITAAGYASQTQNISVSETAMTLDFELVAHPCPSPRILHVEELGAQQMEVAWSNTTTVTLEAHNVWPDGSGYQMLIDPTANTYGTIIPTAGPLTNSGDAPQSVYDSFEYKIPENADGSTTTTHVVVNGQESIVIPSGTYDFCFTNPTPNDRIWIASDYCEVSGRQNDFVFEAGKHYHFTITESENGDCVSLVITDLDRDNQTFNLYRDDIQIASNLTESTYVDEYDLVTGQVYCYKVEAVCSNGNVSDMSDEVCSETVGIDEHEFNTRIYPNPADDFCRIEGDNIKNVSVFNALGELIENVIITGEDSKINTAAYQNGIYMFRIYTNDGSVATKTVVVVH